MSDTIPPEDDGGAEIVRARLFTHGPEIAPPPAVWAAIDASLDAQSATIDRKADGFWAATAPGVQTKLLWDGRSLLIQCEIGAVIPEHEHYADERIMVISGDMEIDGQSFGVGDTVWMAKGTHHGQTTTKTGCLILISYVG
jgi:anti-sigma factor ChrR (cupin superfamily)